MIFGQLQQRTRAGGPVRSFGRTFAGRSRRMTIAHGRGCQAKKLPAGSSTVPDDCILTVTRMRLIPAAFHA